MDLKSLASETQEPCSQSTSEKEPIALALLLAQEARKSTIGHVPDRRQTDPHLAWLVAVWHRLPEKDQRAILEIARKGTERAGKEALWPRRASICESASANGTGLALTRRPRTRMTPG